MLCAYLCQVTMPDINQFGLLILCLLALHRLLIVIRNFNTGSGTTNQSIKTLQENVQCTRFSCVGGSIPKLSNLDKKSKTFAITKDWKKWAYNHTLVWSTAKEIVSETIIITWLWVTCYSVHVGHDTILSVSLTCNLHAVTLVNEQLTLHYHMGYKNSSMQSNRNH